MYGAREGRDRVGVWGPNNKRPYRAEYVQPPTASGNGAEREERERKRGEVSDERERGMSVGARGTDRSRERRERKRRRRGKRRRSGKRWGSRGSEGDGESMWECGQRGN